MSIWSVVVDPIRDLATRVLQHFVLEDFHEALARMTIIDRFHFLFIHIIDRTVLWHRLPVFLGVIYLTLRRGLHQKYNLINVGKSPVGVKYNPSDFPLRNSDGKLIDPFKEDYGTIFFGRNALPVDQKHKLLKPDPFVVARKLLDRRTYRDNGKQINLIAASWTQFMIHEWMDHMEDTTSKQVELTAPRKVARQCPLTSFKFYKIKEIPTDFYEIKSGAATVRNPWWDGSAIYGSNDEVLHKVRTFKDGKLKISKEGHLEHDENGVAISGDIRNSWAGVSTLQALFVKEHNAICDALKKEYPLLEDEGLYIHARLVVTAVIAKIHTIDWTCQILNIDTTILAQQISWYGLLGKKFKDTFGHAGTSLLGGMVGMKKPTNHGVTYSLTEEFSAVYRMHSLLPDSLELRDISATPGPDKTPPLIEEIPMVKLIGLPGEKTLTKIGVKSQLVSMGHQGCGALKLWNYPHWLKDLVPHNADGTERPDHVDLATLEIYRDRENNVARYNQLRRALLMPPITKWQDLTDDEEAIQVLEEVYGDDVEELDLQVGLMAEKYIKGFAFSETAFLIFLLMAARRLEADRFFTSDFTEEAYTKKGFEWVNTTESLKDVINRHYPEMVDKWLNASSAFTVWDAPPNTHNPLPLFLR